MGVFITGGAGFIGSHLARYYRDRGKDVFIFDIKVSPALDIRKKEAILEYLNQEDIVFHLAALINARESEKKKEAYFATNVTGSFNVYNAALEIGAKKVIFASSVAVYPREFRGVITEATSPAPTNFYGYTKLFGELLLDSVLEKDLPWAALRLSNVYGPNGHGIINIFAERIKQRKPLLVFGDGLQERDFIYVTDVVRAFAMAAERGTGVFNICTGKNTSILEIIQIFEEILGKKLPVKFLKEKDPEKLFYTLSNERAKKILGWKPEISLKEGIGELL